IHEITLAKELLTCLNVGSGKQYRAIRSYHLRRNRSAAPIQEEAAGEHDGEAEKQRNQQAVFPKPGSVEILRIHSRYQVQDQNTVGCASFDMTEVTSCETGGDEPFQARHPSWDRVVLAASRKHVG